VFPGFKVTVTSLFIVLSCALISLGDSAKYCFLILRGMEQPRLTVQGMNDAAETGHIYPCRKETSENACIERVGDGDLLFFSLHSCL
jgi:hypothetical protein